MTKSTLDVEATLKRAAPLTRQHAHEIQPFGHLVRMPDCVVGERARTASII
jgi:hypothetical protein